MREACSDFMEVPFGKLIVDFVSKRGVGVLARAVEFGARAYFADDHRGLI
jgi:hypothetical protein